MIKINQSNSKSGSNYNAKNVEEAKKMKIQLQSRSYKKSGKKANL